MSYPPRTWKAFELRVAKWVNGQRRGADYRGYSHGKNDIIKPGWSIEVKLLKQPHWRGVIDACKQAELAKDNPNDIAVAVVKQNGDRDEDTLFVMRRDEFLQSFIGGYTGQDDNR